MLDHLDFRPEKTTDTDFPMPNMYGDIVQIPRNPHHSPSMPLTDLPQRENRSVWQLGGLFSGLDHLVKFDRHHPSYFWLRGSDRFGIRVQSQDQNH